MGRAALMMLNVMHLATAIVEHAQREYLQDKAAQNMRCVLTRPIALVPRFAGIEVVSASDVQTRYSVNMDLAAPSYLLTRENAHNKLQATFALEMRSAFIISIV